MITASVFSRSSDFINGYIERKLVGDCLRERTFQYPSNTICHDTSVHCVLMMG